MSAVDRLLKQYDRRNSSSFKLKAGESAIVRLLPPYPPEAAAQARKLGGDMDPQTGICICRTHAWLPKLPLEQDKKEGNRYFCTNWRCLKDFKKPCPFCAFFDSLDRKNDWGIIGKSGSKPSPMIDLYVKSEGVCKRWYMTQKATLERFRDIFNTVHDINDVKTGKWLKIRRVGADLDTEYPIEVMPPEYKKKFNLSEDQYPDDIYDQIKEYPIIAGPKAANKVLRAAFPEMV